MSETQPTRSITVRCPTDIVDSIDKQVAQTRQNKTNVIIDMLLSSMPSLHITQRAKLPAQPGIYFVYTPNHKLLYIGKADNLKTRWNSHHKYQYFIESSIQCRIGYFTFNSVDNLNETIEEFKSEPIETTTGSTLVTADQFEQLQLELKALKKQFNDAIAALAQLGTDSVIKKLKNYLPTRGRLEWSPSAEDRREGITRSDLIQKFGFSTTKDFEESTAFLELDPDEYLEELSGWQKRPVESGSSRMRFFAPK